MKAQHSSATGVWGTARELVDLARAARREHDPTEADRQRAIFAAVGGRLGEVRL